MTFLALAYFVFAFIFVIEEAQPDLSECVFGSLVSSVFPLIESYLFLRFHEYSGLQGRVCDKRSLGRCRSVVGKRHHRNSRVITASVR